VCRWICRDEPNKRRGDAGATNRCTNDRGGAAVKQLGDILLENGLVTATQLATAYEEHQRSGRSLGRVLVEQGVLTEGQLVAALATQIGLRFVDLSDFSVDGSAVLRVPNAVCRRYTVLPVGYEDGKLLVAMADPANVFAIDDIRSLTGMDVKPAVATRADVLSAINRYHRVDSELDDLTMTLTGVDDLDDDLSNVSEVVEDAPVVKFVNLLITQAIQDRASDIHIEPNERDLRVRYRIDGVLHEVMRSPKNIQSGVTSRLKIMAEINIAERRVPQDGRMSVTTNGKKVDLRVATLPTVWGEKVVMRILDNSTAMLNLSDLGFSAGNYERYAQSFTKPYGMLLVTGPTGSGKSTTLYATLNIVNSPDKNVITVEDPVEYRLAGINQVQTNAKAGLTFASALRSILRSDPDIVLIGEIRDHETAQIAIEAALTGHLVLSTLHTNDAPSAISRLIEMGIEPFLVGSALDCVLAQRLARRLCSKCKEAYVPTPEALIQARYPWQDGAELPTLFRPKGCSACSKTGYKGRLALHEVMAITEQVERLAVERASAEAIGAVARQQGMVVLRDDGLAKVTAGVTSLEEIFRVVV
jgi:type IV pilus assembly protein PilB